MPFGWISRDFLSLMRRDNNTPKLSDQSTR
jgi:hypothetical protein